MLIGCISLGVVCLAPECIGGDGTLRSRWRRRGSGVSGTRRALDLDVVVLGFRELEGDGKMVDPHASGPTSASEAGALHQRLGLAHCLHITTWLMSHTVFLKMAPRTLKLPDAWALTHGSEPLLQGKTMISRARMRRVMDNADISGRWRLTIAAILL